jgi:mycofactocin precursor
VLGTVESRTREVLMPKAQNDPTTPESAAAEPTAAEQVDAELLVEDVSIDGMCGVY